MSVSIGTGQSEIDFRTQLAVDAGRDYQLMLRSEDSAYEVYGLVYARQLASQWKKIASLELARRNESGGA